MLPGSIWFFVIIGDVNKVAGIISMFFMVTYGASLVKTTYFQAYPEFQYIRVGVAYSAIPIAGLITLLFVIEKVFFRPSIKDPEGSDV